MQNSKTLKQNSAILFMCLAVLCVGLFHEFLSAVFSIILSIRIIYLMIKSKKLVIKVNAVSTFVTVLLLGYLCSSLWAIDSGVALFGFVKFLPVFLFLLLCYQEGIRTETILNVLPYFMTIITILTSILMNIPMFESLFAVAGRLSGTFQYSNTYAILCLVSIIIAFLDQKFNVIKVATLLILTFGILYSGSRTVFVLMIATFFVLFFKIRSKQVKLFFGATAALAIAVFAGYAFLTNNTDLIDRFFRISLNESTFVGRILYWYDAFPQILKHPFGMGYMGYYFSQTSFQTGVYSVMFVHNDFIQILLDVGWIPFLILCVAIVKTLFSKAVSFTRKFALIILSLHVLFDFDLQFVAVFMVFILLLDWDSGKEHCFTYIKSTSLAISILVCINLYLGSALFFHYIGNEELSLEIYDYNTFAKIEQIKDTTNLNKLNKLSGSIIEQNKYVSIAYDAKARYAYSKGDFSNVISLKKEAIKYNYYDIFEYEDMFEMLMVGASMYKQSGDTYSYDYCMKELKRIPSYVDEAQKKLSFLGKRIKDQPEFKFSEEINTYLTELEAYESEY